MTVKHSTGGASDYNSWCVCVCVHAIEPLNSGRCRSSIHENVSKASLNYPSLALLHTEPYHGCLALPAVLKSLQDSNRHMNWKPCNRDLDWLTFQGFISGRGKGALLPLCGLC